MENVVRVLSTLALMGAVRHLAGRFENETGIRIDADFAPTIGLLERLRSGEGADVVILTKEALEDLAVKIFRLIELPGAVESEGLVEGRFRRAGRLEIHRFLLRFPHGDGCREENGKKSRRLRLL